MSTQQSHENLSTEELRRLLVEKQRSDRQQRLAYFQRTGRVIETGREPRFETPQAPAPQVPVAAEVVDEESAGTDNKSISTGRRARRKTTNSRFEKILYYVEIGAVVGLVGILLFVFIRINMLNREVASVLQ